MSMLSGNDHLKIGLKVDEVYNRLLERDADEEGKINSISMIKRGGTYRKLVESIIKSQEYKTHWESRREAGVERVFNMCQGLSIADKVELCYNETLDRGPDDSGRHSLTNYIKGGHDLKVAIRNLFNSSEYNEKNTKVREYSALLKNYDFTYKRTSKYTVKYVGSMGVTGYSKATKNLVLSLITQGVDVIFKPLSIHGSIDDSDEDNVKLLSLTSDRDYDILVVHAVPKEWKRVIQKEQNMHGRKPIYGITVWETDDVPKNWISALNSVDLVSVPNAWNRETFQKRIDTPVETVYHPVEQPKPVRSISKRGYTFYTINAWSERKGVADVVKCYLEEFSSKDNVTLYVKTSEPCAAQEVKAVEETLTKDSPRIVFDIEDVSADRIRQIHASGDCYVTLAKAEGQGLGACEAAMYNKPIITNSYGAQTEYIKGAFNVSYTVVPAGCDGSEKHNKCKGSVCSLSPAFDASYQNWSQPNLEEAKKLMRWVYENDIKEGNVYTKQYLNSFSYENVGANLDKSLQRLLAK